MQIYLSLLVCVLGILAFALSDNAKVSQMGFAAYWVGLFVFLLKWDAAPFGLIGR